jgi:hypothetical protein
MYSINMLWERSEEKWWMKGERKCKWWKKGKKGNMR